MKKVWYSADTISQLQKCSFDCEGKSFLSIQMKKSDTPFILYVAYAKLLRFDSVTVHSPDTDIFFILLYHSLSISKLDQVRRES